jgi:prepilin-type processing-associated H-X9-DG protein
LRGVHRWADPDAGGSGVSGPDNADIPNVANGVWFKHYVNNNSYPMGGPPLVSAAAPAPGDGCPWTFNNCGLNDEPFSFHPGGCNAVFADGSVHFIGETISPEAMRALITRSEGVKVPSDEFPK